MDLEEDVGPRSRRSVVKAVDAVWPFPEKHRENLSGIHVKIAFPFPFGVFFR